MKLSIDKPQIFEGDEVETITIDNATFEVNSAGHLLIKHQSTKDIIGYFPKDKLDCVYRDED